jgi:hypothetical protein
MQVQVAERAGERGLRATARIALGIRREPPSERVLEIRGEAIEPKLRGKRRGARDEE